MIVFKIAPVLLLALLVGADKKIELQDIEEDNLKSEKDLNYETVESDQEDVDGKSPKSVPVEYLKSGLLRYYKGPNPTQVPQQQRYIQQYAVTETQERSAVTPAPQYGPPEAQQDTANYLSNVPMQFYLIPQYEVPSNTHTEAHYTGQGARQLSNYQNPEPEEPHAKYEQPHANYEQPHANYEQSHANYEQSHANYEQSHANYEQPQANYEQPQANYEQPQTNYEQPQANYEQPHANYEQPQANYEEVQAYVAPTAKPHIESYQSPVNYVSFSAQPSVSSTPATGTAVVYNQAPVVHYQNSVVAPPTVSSNPQNILTKFYYSNDNFNQGKVAETQGNDIETQSYYHVQTEVPYIKSQAQDVPRYYNSRTPLREQYTNSIAQLPRPSPLLLKAPPPHLAHIPKALPMRRPWGKAVYNNGGLGVNSFANRPIEPYNQFFKRGPTSLLDSYIPSSIQIEYLKRGIIKDPLLAYEALSSKRQFAQPPPSSRHFEGGFLPNQVFHTANGGSFYGHFKRSPKLDRRSRS